MRPVQWLKNMAVFIALIFSRSLFDPSAVVNSVIAFVYFCLISGLSYVVNDVYDKEQDKSHPLKSKRPIASGALKEKTAVWIALVSAPAIIISCFFWSWKFAVMLSAYFILQIAYSSFLKHIVLVDILAVSLGFVLRVFGGAVAINVKASSWLLFCTVLLSLFLSLCKRRHEILLMKEGALTHRKALKEYSPFLLDQLISFTTSTFLVCYILYTISPETTAKFGTENLKYSAIFILYGIFRYLYLTYSKDMGGSPENILISDRSFQANMILYSLFVIAVIYLI